VWVVAGVEPVAALMPPVGVAARPLSSTSLRLSWAASPPPASPGDSAAAAVYTVRCGERARRRRYRYVNVTATSTTLERLRADTEYELSVRVTRGRRHSTWSMAVLVTTQQARSGTSHILRCPKGRFVYGPRQGALRPCNSSVVEKFNTN